MSPSDVLFNLAIAKARPHQCKITVGVHPYHAAEADTGGEKYFEHLSQSIIGIIKEDPNLMGAYGELGLDYDRLEKAPKEAQIRVFKRQLDFMVQHQLQLPLFLHCRASFEDFVAILKPYLLKLPDP